MSKYDIIIQYFPLLPILFRHIIRWDKGEQHVFCYQKLWSERPERLCLLLILHYVEQECIAESSAVARPHNETVEQICAYLAANYRQKFSLTEVAAQFYLSPYYLSRLFRRVTGCSQ